MVVGWAKGGNSISSVGSKISSVGGPLFHAFVLVRPVAMVLGSKEESVDEVEKALAYLLVVLETRLVELLVGLALFAERAWRRWGA